MTNMKHTPGPWEHRGLTMISGRKADDVKFTLANVTPAGDLHYATESAANARLIAAAPELLEALGLALATIERLERHAPGTAQGTRDVIAAAIAKAEGFK